MVQLVHCSSPMIDGLLLTVPTATQVKAFGHETPFKRSFRAEEFADSKWNHR